MTAIAAPARTIRFQGPSVRDARLHTAGVLLTIQLLGQTILEFRLSIAQLLISIGTSAVLELLITFRREHAVVWPASAMLTGNGVALILRVPGTAHGEWWSTRGWWIFAGTAALSLLSKYAFRVRGSHIFNPSNLGLVLCFLVLGSDRVEPLDFWWGPWSTNLAVAITVISVGGVLILSRLRLLVLALTFWIAFAGALLVVTAVGHCMTTRWSIDAVCGREFWWLLVTSPEVLIFLFFMITDPKTVPTTSRSRVVYAVSIALLAALLIAPQRNEFGAKVALLGALTIVCAARPIVHRVLERRGDAPSASLWTQRRTMSAAPVVAIAVIFGLVASGTPARPESLARERVDFDFPEVAPDAIPTVTIADDRLSSQVSESDAAMIAQHLVQDLMVHGDLLRRRDTASLGAIADRSWRDELELRMRDATQTCEVDVVNYDLDHIVVSVAMRRGQAAPAVLASMFGTVQIERYRDGISEPIDREPRRDLRGDTFEVLWDGARYVVISDQLPDGFEPPRSVPSRS